MESSRKIITRRWFNFLGFYIVVGVLLVFGLVGSGVIVGFLSDLFNSDAISFVLGLMVFFVAMLALPYYYLTQFAAFDDIVLQEDGYSGMIDDIGAPDEGPDANL